MGAVVAYHHSGSYEIREVFDPRIGVFDVDHDLDTDEVQLGLRVTIDVPILGDGFLSPEPLHFYINGGVSFVFVDADISSSPFGTSRDYDSDTGYWFGGGVYLDLLAHLSVGIDIKYSHADVTIFGLDRNAGGLFVGFTVAFRF